MQSTRSFIAELKDVVQPQTYCIANTPTVYHFRRRTTRAYASADIDYRCPVKKQQSDVGWFKSILERPRCQRLQSAMMRLLFANGFELHFDLSFSNVVVQQCRMINGRVPPEKGSLHRCSAF